MRVLLTRPADDSAALAAKLEPHGISSSIEPMLEIDYLDMPEPGLTGVQGLLITSTNGIRAFARVSDRRDIALWAVGPGSANEALQLGFERVEHAAGDVAALTTMVGERVKPDAGTLLHVAGSHVAGDLAGALTDQGYDYRRVVMYQAHKREHFSDAIIQTLRAGLIEGVVLYSPRTAASVVHAIRAANIEGACETVTVFCLSGAVAKEIASITWQHVDISPEPDENSMVSRVLQSAATE